MGSLQVRLFFTFLAVIVVTLGLTALSLFLQIGGYRDSITYRNLEDLGRVLDSTANAEIKNGAATPPDASGGQVPEANAVLLGLRALLSEQDSGTVSESTSVLIVDAGGRVIPDLVASSLDIDALSRATVDDNNNQPDDATGDTALRTPRRCELRLPGGPTELCVRVPLTQEVRSSLGHNASSMVVARPAAGLGELLSDLGPQLLFSGLIGLAAALVLGFLFIGSLSAPLRSLSRAARNIARGNYKQRVPVRGPHEIRDVAENFNRMAAEVQRSQQTLRDFLANISHELKTPLTSIRGFSEALLDGTIDDAPGIARSARVINGESNRLLRLVQELLDLSRIESGQVSMGQDEFLLAELLGHVSEVFALRSDEAGVSLIMDPSAGISVRGDFDRLEQVLDNLIDNAFRHTPRGGNVRVSAHPLGPGTVQVTIADTGPGIPEAEIPHLFERFYRGNGANATRGYGLGLAITREIVRAHGGNIWVTSEPGRGTTFIFTLPTAAPALTPSSR